MQIDTLFTIPCHADVSLALLLSRHSYLHCNISSLTDMFLVLPKHENTFFAGDTHALTYSM